MVFWKEGSLERMEKEATLRVISYLVVSSHLVQLSLLDLLVCSGSLLKVALELDYYLLGS